MCLAPSREDQWGDRCAIGEQGIEACRQAAGEHLPLATIEFHECASCTGLRFSFVSPEPGTHGLEGRIRRAVPRIDEADLHLCIAQITQCPEQSFRTIAKLLPGGIVIEPPGTARSRSAATQGDAKIMDRFLARVPARCGMQPQDVAHPARKCIRGGRIGVVHRYMALYQGPRYAPGSLAVTSARIADLPALTTSRPERALALPATCQG